MNIQQKLADALAILSAFDLPRAQQNERSALCLLAICDMTPDKSWHEAANPLIGITSIMDWARRHYQKEYAPNTRETIRRQTMHQFVDAGIALYNPDAPERPVNSPKAVYQISPEALYLVRHYGLYKGKQFTMESRMLESIFSSLFSSDEIASAKFHLKNWKELKPY